MKGMKFKATVLAMTLVAGSGFTLNATASDKVKSEKQEVKTWLDLHKDKVEVVEEKSITKTPKGEEIKLLIVKDKQKPYRKKSAVLQISDLIIAGDIQYILTKDGKAILNPNMLSEKTGKVDATNLVNDFLKKYKGNLITFYKGNPNAKKKLLVIVEPNCPACRRASKVLKQLADKGEVYIQYVVTAFIAPNSKMKAAWIDSQKDKADALYKIYDGKVPSIDAPVNEIKKEMKKEKLQLFKSIQKAEKPIEYFGKYGLGYTPLIFEKSGDKWYLTNPQ